MPNKTTLFDAVGYFDRAEGMREVARRTGLSRENLYKAFSAKSNPEFATILKAISAPDIKNSATVE